MKRNPRLVLAQSEIESVLLECGVKPELVYRVVTRLREVSTGSLPRSEQMPQKLRLLRLSQMANQVFMAKRGVYIDVFPSKLSASKRGVLKRLDEIIMSVADAYGLKWEDVVKLYFRVFVEKTAEYKGKKASWVGTLVADWVAAAVMASAKEKDHRGQEGWWKLVEQKRKASRNSPTEQDFD